MYRFKAPNKRRPVLILSRQDVIPLLDTVMVAPITSSIRGAPGEVVVDQSCGLKHASAINLDHVQTVSQAAISQFVGSISPEQQGEVCRRLMIATGCDSLSE